MYFEQNGTSVPKCLMGVGIALFANALAHGGNIAKLL